MDEKTIAVEEARVRFEANPTDVTRGLYNLALIRFSRMRRTARKKIIEKSRQEAALKSIEKKFMAAIEDTKKENSLLVDEIDDLTEQTKEKTKQAEKKSKPKKKKTKAAAKSAVKSGE